MDLRETPPQQLVSLVDWLRYRFNPEEPLAQAPWKELCEEAAERATFLETFVIPKVEEHKPYLPAAVHVIRGVGHAPEMEGMRIATYVGVDDRSDDASLRG